ncbi:lachrymatory-factor synthase-like [Abrus precatorius]|uniref:Lachrymatory-factor synthase-like n=1 Tax=Abrus precatorius TaxID=3816 RepID=A0A8B8JNU6_ABRPR|nr:lachrymatory-factor synthase-like [Abrus precatorius]
MDDPSKFEPFLLWGEMESDLHQRWEGRVSANLRNATKEQAWPLVKDFFNLHKRFPTLATCYGIHGSNGEPGCIRYCAGSSIASNGSGSVSWSKERLVAVDDFDLILKYEIVDSNIGFKSYESTIKVLSTDDSDGCMLEWSFAVDPVEGWVFEDLVGKYHVGLQFMAQKMEEEIASPLGEIMC